MNRRSLKTGVRNTIEGPQVNMAKSLQRAFPRGPIALALSLAACLVAAPGASAAEGDNFSFAPVAAEGTVAQAFLQGPDARAFWAGVCDLRNPAAAIGAPPANYAHCIDQRTYNGNGIAGFLEAVVPPLAPGVAPGDAGPNGWYKGMAPGPVLVTPALGTEAPSWRLADATQAGSHPDGSTSFWFSRSPTIVSGAFIVIGSTSADGAPREIAVKLPPGVVGNPRAMPKCPAEDLRTVPTTCPPKTQVGVSTIALSGISNVYPVYNVEPRDGKTAEFVISGAGLVGGTSTNVSVIATARTDQDFGAQAKAVEIPAGFPLTGQTFTFWGVPWAKSHDRYRPAPAYCGPATFDTIVGGGMPAEGLPGGFGGPPPGCSQEQQSYDPSWGPIRPFLTTQTECSPQNPITSIRAANWHTDVIASATSPAALLAGCANIEFPLDFGLSTSSAADAPTGLEADLSIPQNNDPPLAKRFNADDSDPNSAIAHWKSTAGLARAHLKDSVVTLPGGFALNPSVASGLVACSDSGVGVRDGSTNPLLFNDGDPFDGDGTADGADCPDESVIGTAEVSTPLLEADEKLTGQIVLGEPQSTDPSSGKMLRMFLVVRNHERALVAKIHGTATADGAVGPGGDGQLQATFENNPQVPFDNLELKFKGGERGVLATPQQCGGANDWDATFTPWSGGAAVEQGGQFPVGSNCGYSFTPTLASGMSTAQARRNGSFSFRFARTDGQQWFEDLTAELPAGLLASVRGLIGSSLCSDAQANAGTCPASSRIGTVDAKAGAGDPFVLEQKGEAFLTQGYRGGEYGLAVKVRGIAGPFRGANELKPIIVRQALHVDRTTAKVTAVSDEFPTIWHGVPLRVREVTVNIDRDGFMLNPSNCGAKQVTAVLGSVEGQQIQRSNSFGTTGCAALPFKPKLALKLTGRKQTRTGRHPGVRAVVTQSGVGEAGIKRAEVRLPKSLALDPNNAQALCEFADGTKADPENRCPKGSIVGRARATSPLLNNPLVGNVYFVKNVRIDPTTGNQIRTLPMLIVALRGEIAVNLRGDSSTTKSGKLVNTFASVPDAPVSQFNLNINGGENGILAVTRTRKAKINLCDGKQIAEVDTDGQNGRRHDFDVSMKTPCKKRKASKKAAR
jgi:hypothetical protein